MAYDWHFEEKCWVISNLDLVTNQYREQVICTFDKLFALFQDEFESYAVRAEEMRDAFAKKGREFVILLRKGDFGMVDPLDESITPIEAEQVLVSGA